MCLAIKLLRSWYRNGSVFITLKIRTFLFSHLYNSSLVNLHRLGYKLYLSKYRLSHNHSLILNIFYAKQLCLKLFLTLTLRIQLSLSMFFLPSYSTPFKGSRPCSLSSTSDLSKTTLPILIVSFGSSLMYSISESRHLWKPFSLRAFAVLHLNEL